MRRWATLFAGVVMLALVGGALLPGATAAPVVAGLGVDSGGAGDTDPRMHSGGMRLLASSDQGVTLQVSVPWDSLGLDPVVAEGADYVRVSLPGWASTAQTGAPELPFLSAAIGVPFGVELDVQVEPGPAHTLALPAPVLPVATHSVDRGAATAPGAPGTEGLPVLPVQSVLIEEDAAIYEGDAVYPVALASVTSDGVVRAQRVAGIAAYPVQVNPATRELTVYESLRVVVSFEGQVAPGAATDDSRVYEQVFRESLLNYEAARAWRSTLSPPSVSGPSGQASPNARGESVPWVPPSLGWRVKVREEGFYRLTYAELLAAGLPVGSGLPTSTFQILYLGSESAIWVDDTDEDGIYDPEDSLLFYGQPTDSKYTADNVYWLTYGQGPGLRMGSRDGTPGEGATPDYYSAERRMEANAYYWTKAPGDDSLERWLWDYIYTPVEPSWSHTFSLAAPYPGDYDGALLTAVLLGGLSHEISPDHHVRISLNGTEVADVWWDGIAWKTVEVPVAQDLVQPGNNTLTVVCPNDTGVGFDYVWVDRVELRFASAFAAEADELAFGYEESGTWKFQVDGFTTDDLVVYDVTNPADVVRIEGAGVSGSGPYSLLFEETIGAPTKYWAMAGAAFRTVQAIEEDTASDLGSTANGADHIVITHQEFAAAAAQLRDWRVSQGWRAMSVDVQDVYDEFGYGIVGVEAIHGFLAYAYHEWQAPAPSFVVMMGDGHFDPKDYTGYGRVSYIPPYLAAADPWWVETAADNRYVTLVGDDTFPDMMLGRLAVNSTAQASAFVDKIVAYEGSPVPGDWRQQILAVADNAEGGLDFAGFKEDVLACCLPEPYEAERVYYLVTHFTVPEARAAILGGINAGKLIVNYAGHGANSLWAAEGLFLNTDVAGLTNGSKLPVMLPMTCLDGYYIYPQASISYDSLAEVVTRAAGKGAVASWSPTGMGVLTGHEYLDRGFFSAVFEDGLLGLGAATTAAKMDLWDSGYHYHLLDTYLLFGDPATEIALPEEPPSPGLMLTKTTNGEDANEPPGPYVLVGDPVTWDYAVTNTGNVELANVVVTDDRLGAVCTIPSLPAGESESCLMDGIAAAGQYANVGSATGTPPGGLPDVSDTDPSHYFGAITGLSLAKTTNGEDADSPPGPYVLVGDPVSWEYAVTNTGNVDLSNVVVTDDQLGAVCTIPSLPAGESESCFMDGVAGAGQYANVGSATGTPSGGLPDVSDTDPSHYFGAITRLTLAKTTNGEDANEPPGPYVLVGDPVTWGYAVTNTGNVDLANVVVTDDRLGAVCTIPSLLTGEFESCFTDGIAASGQYANVGSATGTPPGGLPDVSDTDASHYFGALVTLDLEKHTNGQDADLPPGPYVLPGDPVTWSYLVTNTGNVDLSEISVWDDNGTPGDPGDDYACEVGNLPPGGSDVSTCTQEGTAIEGQYTNTGSAQGSFGEWTAVNSDHSHYLGTTPGLDLEKWTNGQDADDLPGPYVLVGEAVTWTYIVTNTGELLLLDITVVDDNGTPGYAGDDYVCGIEMIPPGGSDRSCVQTGVAQPGQYENIGFAEGTSGGFTPSDSDPSHYFGAAVGLTLEKRTNGEDADSPPGPYLLTGDDVTWEYTVTNEGNVTLSSIGVADDQLGAVCTIASLPAGDSESCSIEGVAAEGQYANVGSATGMPPGGLPEVVDTDPSHYFGAHLALQLRKRTNGQDANAPPGPYIQAGEPVTWTYTVTNTGNVELVEVQVVDDQGVDVTCPDVELSPGESMECGGDGISSVGQYHNTGTVLGIFQGSFVSAADHSYYYGIAPGRWVYLPLVMLRQ